jgi:hypothetical protein
MKGWIEKLLVRFWNRFASRKRSGIRSYGLDLGARVSDGVATSGRVAVPHGMRTAHIAVLGRTGTGKSSLLRYMAQQAIKAGLGFVYFDLHGDATPFLLRSIAAQERLLHEDLSGRLIVIDPADPDFSVGLNPLERHDTGERFVQIAEVAQLLKERWHLESFGARTDELLRNSLYVLAENGLTLLELAPLLSHSQFRASCLKNVRNPEIKQYFLLRYDQVSEPMRATMREPILNKISAFTGDSRFRHIVGQQRSTFSVVEAMDQGYWGILNFPKGRLGEQATTLGSLFMSRIKNALFARKSHEVFTIFCDEIQNLVSYGDGLEMVLSESRKFGISIVSANQFLDQHSPEMRSALLAVGTHVFFQLSAPDAQQIAAALDGGKPLAELLKNLQRRHMVVKTGHERWQEAVVPTVSDPNIDFSDLYNRSRARWARKRSEIEQEIAKRQEIINRNSSEALNDWQ